MADIRNPEAFIKSRFKWNEWGYEDALAGRCGFTDIDAATERNGHYLFVEQKPWRGRPDFKLDTGQRIFYERLVAKHQTVAVLLCGSDENTPMAIEFWTAPDGKMVRTARDWSGLSTEQRRQSLRQSLAEWASHAEGRRTS